MSQPLEVELREWLAQYLASQISLKEFTTWFAPATWNIHQAGSQAAQELAYEIDHRLAEYTSRHWTEDDLRRLLAEAIAEAPSTSHVM